MLSSIALLKLQRNHGLPALLSYKDQVEWPLYPRLMSAWLKNIPKTTVYTLDGVTQRPLVKHRGILTDLVTGSQFGTTGKCLSSLQIALQPFEYINKRAKRGKA